MSVEAFLDTNIFVYAFDETAPEKRQIAEQLIQEGLCEETAVIRPNTGSTMRAWRARQKAGA